MLKARSSALAASLALATLTTGATAAAPALAEKAEAAKGLAEATLSRLEELLAKLEVDCDAGRFPEAGATAAEIESALAGK
jgi:hypothetical protein